MLLFAKVKNSVLRKTLGLYESPAVCGDIMIVVEDGCESLVLSLSQ